MPELVYGHVRLHRLFPAHAGVILSHYIFDTVVLLLAVVQ